MKVFLVGDDADFLRVLGYGLRQRGHAVAESPLSYSALEQAQAFVPDVALLDIPPGVLVDLRQYRQLIPAIASRWVPVIVSTVLRETRQKMEWQQMGAAAVLSKPFLVRELLSTLECLEQVPRGEEPFQGYLGEMS